MLQYGQSKRGVRKVSQLVDVKIFVLIVHQFSVFIGGK